MLVYLSQNSTIINTDFIVRIEEVKVSSNIDADFLNLKPEDKIEPTNKINTECRIYMKDNFQINVNITLKELWDIIKR